MLKFINYVRIILTAGVQVLIYHIFYSSRYARHPEKYPLSKRYYHGYKIMSAIMKAFRVEYHVEGLENIKDIDEKTLFISNHYSEADPLLIISLFKNPITFVAKLQTLKMPFIGKALKSINGIPIDRDNVMNQIGEIKSIVNLIKDKDNANLCIFAEGTRNKNPQNEIMELKAGSLKMGYMAKATIVPISLYGTFRIFSIHHYLKRYPVYIKFGKPVCSEEYENIKSVDLADIFKKQIDKDVLRFKNLDKKEVCAQHLSKKRRLFEIKNDI